LNDEPGEMSGIGGVNLYPSHAASLCQPVTLAEIAGAAQELDVLDVIAAAPCERNVVIEV
jgi:hypothetical protein